MLDFGYLPRRLGAATLGRRRPAAVTALAIALLAGVAGPSPAQRTGDSPDGGITPRTVPPTGTQPAGGDQPGGGGAPPPTPVSGGQVYREICQACHMADAKGGSGAGTIPALAGNPRLAGAAYPITVVVRGKGAMPPFNALLKPAQVAAVVGYVRTNFGNAYAKPVTEEDVRKLWVAPSDPDH